MKDAKCETSNVLPFEPRQSEDRQRSYLRFGKRLFDILFALVLLPLIAPVVLLLTAVARSDGGPGIFGHERVGRHGRPFKCFKIRSMVVDAERRLNEHLSANPEAAAEWASDFKLANDPRVTRFGYFIRRTSLDELPQVWNVLLGDMSFVGPRPVVAHELERYGDKQNAYLAMRPGLTGPWQVLGRNDLSYNERVRLDCRYLEEQGLLTDLALMVRTSRAVFGRTGR